MAKVKFFGVLRLDTSLKELDISAKTVKELLDMLSLQTEKLKDVDLKSFVIFVNAVNITKLKLFKTPLKDSDTVTIMSPVSGG